MRWVGFALLVSLNSWADIDVVKKKFEERFHSGYTATKCHDNILGLVRAVKPHLKGGRFYVVTFRNKGYGTFSLVNAEVARGESGGKPVEKESNFFNHVVLMDDRGQVYDFDFTTKPSVVPMEEYIERMFLDEEECKAPRPREFCGGRENKLADYEVESIDALESLRETEHTPRRTVTLGDVLKDWRVLR